MNYSRILTAKTAFLSHTVFLDQEFGNGLARWFWLSASHENVVRIFFETTVTKGTTGLLRQLTYKIGEFRGVHGISPQGLRHRAAWVSSAYGSWLPQAMRSKIEKGGRHNIFYNLVSKVPLCQFCSVKLVTHVSCILCKREPARAWIPGGDSHRDSWPAHGRTGKGVGI